MHTIELFCHNGNWMAKHSDHAIKELFGTDTLPTAFISLVPHETVLGIIRELNPNHKVIIRALQ